jgi:hypothetical protein
MRLLSQRYFQHCLSPRLLPSVANPEIQALADGQQIALIKPLNIFQPKITTMLPVRAFYPGDDGLFKARKERFAACHFLMLDDLGTKVPFDRLSGLELSWLIETSPGNYQGGIILADPIVGRFCRNSAAHHPDQCRPVPSWRGRASKQVGSSAHCDK